MATTGGEGGRQSALPQRKRKQWNVAAYLMLAPSVVLFLLLVIYPLANTIVYSFYDYGITSVRRPFIGLGNYLELFGDRVFWRALRNNIILLLGSVIIQVGLGAILAAILNRGIQRGTVLFQTIIFAPMVMSVVAVGLLWQLIYDPNIGILNHVMKFLGLPVPPQGWLGDPNIVMYAILVAACWQYTGFMMVLLLAGMQSVPEELYEAATLDGATEAQSFLHITLPGIRNILIVAVLITMIGAFKAFDIVYVLTRGGPANASQVLGIYLFQNAFTLNRAGYANAIAVVLLVFALMLGLLQLRFSRGEKRS